MSNISFECLRDCVGRRLIDFKLLSIIIYLFQGRLLCMSEIYLVNKFLTNSLEPFGCFIRGIYFIFHIGQFRLEFDDYFFVYLTSWFISYSLKVSYLKNMGRKLSYNLIFNYILIFFGNLSRQCFSCIFIAGKSLKW